MAMFNSYVSHYQRVNGTYGVKHDGTWNGYGGWYGGEKRGNEAPKTSHYFEPIYIWKMGDFMVILP